MEPVRRRTRVQSTIHGTISKNSRIIGRTDLEYYSRKKGVLYNEITERSGGPQRLYLALQVDYFGVRWCRISRTGYITWQDNRILCGGDPSGRGLRKVVEKTVGGWST